MPAVSVVKLVYNQERYVVDAISILVPNFWTIEQGVKSLSANWRKCMPEQRKSHSGGQGAGRDRGHQGTGDEQRNRFAIRRSSESRQPLEGAGTGRVAGSFCGPARETHHEEEFRNGLYQQIGQLRVDCTGRKKRAARGDDVRASRNPKML